MVEGTWKPPDYEHTFQNEDGKLCHHPGYHFVACKCGHLFLTAIGSIVGIVCGDPDCAFSRR